MDPQAPPGSTPWGEGHLTDEDLTTANAVRLK